MIDDQLAKLLLSDKTEAVVLTQNAVDKDADESIAESQ